MPILKTQILGSEFKIDYQDSEKEKLLKLIKQFKLRLGEFPLNGKTNDKAIIFLSALKAEDELEENKKLLSKNKVKFDKINEQSKLISIMRNKINILNKELDELNFKNLTDSNNNLLVIEKVKNLEKLIELTKIKIKNAL